MKHHALKLLLVVALLPLGCDSSGPSVNTTGEAPKATAASGGADPVPDKKVTPAADKKREKMGVAPRSFQ